jgi:thiosulfate/3-mercaptopyruvate sulfurtransferase
VFADGARAVGDKRSADGVFRGRHPLPERADGRDAALVGISDDTQVVAYDAHGGMFAARLWWLLRWLGHDAVAVLDGGLPAWQALGQPLSTEAPVKARGDITGKAPLVRTVTADDVLANIGGERTVVDARAPDRFLGENETIDPVGAIFRREEPLFQGQPAAGRALQEQRRAEGRFAPLFGARTRP